MFIYNKKVTLNSPEIKNTKSFKVTLEDVLLTFISSDVKGSNIFLTYSISYFNIPQNVKDIEISSHIDFNSLKEVVNQTVGIIPYTDIYSLTSRVVKFKFDVEAFLKDASYPTNIVDRRGLRQVVLKLNKKVPEIISQTSNPVISDVFSKVMSTLVRNNKKYQNIFKHITSWKYRKTTTVSAVYCIDSNEFVLELKDPLSIIYYY